jgi:hypothetical protein
MVRAQRDAPASFPNILNHLSDDVKLEFWHLVQRLVAEARFPAVICHHFGRWRSADHFHLHIVTRRTDFAHFTASKMTPPGNAHQIIDQITRKEAALVERHINDFKTPEIAAIRQSPPPRKAKYFAPSEWGDFRVELHATFPWVLFVPKVPFVYSRDAARVPHELMVNRSAAFDVIFLFAEQYELADVSFRSNTSSAYGSNSQAMSSTGMQTGPMQTRFTASFLYTHLTSIG